MHQLKFKLPDLGKSSRWKLSKREFGQFRRRYGLDITYDNFLNQLNDLFVYYLSDSGLSVNPDGSEVRKESAHYMWAQINQTYNHEPLSAWMYQKGNGVFCNIAFGTRIEFDKEITKIQITKK